MLTTVNLLDNSVTQVPPAAFAALSSLQSLELGRNNITTLGPSALAGLEKLRYLSLHSNQIAEITADTFRSLVALQTLNLRLNVLTALPAGAFANLTDLTRIDLYGNQVVSIAPGAFAALPALQVVDLEANHVTAVPAGVFTNLPKLRSITLAFNNITAVEAGAFDLPMLAELNFEVNQIAAIAPGAFDNLPQLQKLFFFLNKLSSFPPTLFANLPLLTQLSLTSNKLRAIPPGAFDIGGARLQELRLRNNAIEEIPPGVFRHLTDLRWLEFEGNLLTAIPPDALWTLGQLRELSFHRNFITSLPPNVFANLTRLEILRLGNNRIAMLSPDIFAPLANLVLLEFYFNTLTSLPDGAFSMLDRLQTLDLAFTPIKSIPLAALPPGPVSNGSLGICMVGTSLQCCAIPSATSLDVLAELQDCSTNDLFGKINFFICESPPAVSGVPLTLLSPAQVAQPCLITSAPTLAPTSPPTARPTVAPSAAPSSAPTAQPSTGSKPAPSNSGGGGGGAGGAAIAVGAGVAGALVLAILVVFLVRRRQQRSREQSIVLELKELISQEKLQAEETYRAQFAGTLGSLAESSQRLAQLPVADVQALVLGQELGRGEYGRVVQAEERQGAAPANRARLYAVKMLPEGVSTGPPCVHLLLELRVMAMLEHPHLVRLVGARHSHPPIMLVMEFCDGGNLRDHLRRLGGFRPPELTAATLEWGCWQLASTMAYLHAKMILHRDLAARNVLVQQRALNASCALTLKLADLGLSRPLDSGSEYYRQASDARVPIKWMCPTAVALRRFTKKSDVWSFGVLVWEMFSFGAAPWADQLATEVVLLQQQGRRLPKPAAMSEWIETNIVRGCWAKTEMERPTFPVLLAALSDRLGSGSSAAATTAPAHQAQRQPAVALAWTAAADNEC